VAASSTTVLHGTDAQALSPTFGWFDSVVVEHSNTIRLRGWAATSDFPTTPLGVRAVVDGSIYFFPDTNFRIADTLRTDVGASYPGYGNNHGFDFKIPSTNGSHTVCIQAQNSGVYNQIGNCRSYTVNGSNGEGRFFGRLWQHHEYQVRTVTYSRGTTWSGNIDAGVTSWDPNTPGLQTQLTATSNTSTNVPFVLFDLDSIYGPGVLGVTLIGGTCPTFAAPCLSLPISGTPYVQNTVYLNNANSSMINSGLTRQSVTGHEFGHAIGLAHPWNAGIGTIMVQSISPWRTATPQNWDRQNVDIAYP
jgi:hypothetical protein